MSNKIFTEEELEELRVNPYTQSVTKRCVIFTPDFKRMVYNEYIDGKSIKRIFEDHGISVAVLGEARIAGFTERLNKFADREEGFTSLKTLPKKRSPQDAGLSAAKEIKELKNQLTYLRQEVEFLKKIQKADMEARKAWEAKHRRK